MKVLAIIPAYNEEASLPVVLREMSDHAGGVDCLVINDGSRDRTAETARAVGVGVVSHPVNLGAGAAAQTGFRYAVRRGYDVVIQLDADGQHDPRDIPSLLQALDDEGVDAAIGSRFLEDRGYRPTRMRSVGMSFFNGLATILTGQRVTDSTSCFRALKRPVFKFFAEMDYPTDFQDADLRVLMKRAGFRVQEVAVSMRPRLGGRSFINGIVPAYYVFKVSLSILVTLLREAPRQRRE